MAHTKKKNTHIPDPLMLAAASMLLVYAMYSSPLMLVRAPLMLGTAIVGVSAAVAPNADNTLARELAEKETELAAREAALEGSSRTQRETGLFTSDTLALVSFVTSIALFMLLALNYFFDFRRERRIVRTSVT